MPEDNQQQQSNEFNLMKNSIIRAAIRYRWLIFAIFFITTLGAMVSSSRLVDIYSATATLRFQSETGQATRSLGIWNQMMYYNYRWDMDPIADQIALIRSRSVAEGVVRRLNAYYYLVNKSFKNSHPVSIDVLWLNENHRYFNYWFKFQKDSTFDVYAEESIYIASGKIGDTLNFNFASVYLTLNYLDTGTVIFGFIPIEKAAEGMRGRLSVSGIEQTNMLAITVSDPNPHRAREVVNAFAREIVSFDVQRSRGAARSVREFIEQQLLITNTSLEEAERNLRSIQEKYGWLTASREEMRVEQQLADLVGQRVAAMITVKELEQKLWSLKSELQGQGAFNLYSEAQTIPELSSNPALNAIQEQINKYEIEKAELLGSYTENHPRIRQIDSIVQFLKGELVTTIQDNLSQYGSGPVDQVWSNLASQYIMTEVELASARALLGALETAIEDIRTELDSLPEEIAMFERAYRQVEVEKQTYTTLLVKLQEAKISEATQVGNVSLVDTALTPTRAIGPNRKKNIIIGAFVGLLLGFGLAYLLEKLDTTIRDVEEIEDYLGLNVLGIVPNITEKEIDQHRKIMEGEEESEQMIGENIQSHLITHAAPKSPISEAYRTIRTNIQFSSVTKPTKTLIISSALPKEGKSTTVANLATTFAQQGLKTLVVDTDLRKPVMHHVFDSPRTPGIVEYLLEINQLDEVVRNTGVENLYLVSCGTIPPNPSEVIASENMNSFINKVKQQYDIIIFDSSPLLAVTDASLLSTKTDGTILVIRAEKTDREAAKAALKLLKNVKSEIKGSILNNVVIGAKYGYNYYYRYYYQYYYGHGTTNKIRKRKSFRQNWWDKIKEFFS